MESIRQNEVITSQITTKIELTSKSKLNKNWKKCVLPWTNINYTSYNSVPIFQNKCSIHLF